MTLEQQQAMQAAIMRSNQPLQQPFAMNPYAAGASPYTPAAAAPTAVDPRYAKAAQKYDTETEALSAQRLMAQRLSERGDSAPAMIQAGKLAVAGANPMTALSQGLSSWAGMKERQNADTSSTALAAKQAESQAAAGSIAQQLADEERAAAATAADLAERKFVADTENISVDNEREERALTQTIAAQTATQRTADEKRTLTAYHNPAYDPTDTTSSPVVQARIRPDGNAEDEKGNFMSASGLVPWKPGTDGSTQQLSAAQIKAQAEQKAAVLDVDPLRGGIVSTPASVVSVLRDPWLGSGTGQSWDRIKGQYLPGLTDDGPAIADYQRRVQGQLLDGLIPALIEARLAPVSDSDMDALRERYVDIGSEPFGVVGYMTDEYRPRFNRAFDDAIAAGTHTLEQKQEYMDQVDGALIDAAIKVGYPMERLVTQGLDAEMIKLRQAAVAKQQASPQ
tara:strand:- start:750 stop:2105 length:1356 start_codon:yes stop_codon:yes gene_type:complete